MSQGRLRAGVAMLALAAAASVAPGTTVPAQEAPPPRPSLNLYGVTGLIDMPSAEEQPDGQVSASYSQFGNTQRRNFTFQFLPRMSVTLRYSTIKDFGIVEDPNYDLFDRSLDVQFQLLKEKDWLPAVGLGFRDVLGTGIYSAEYLVATKTVAQDFTLTGGLGWGRLASVGGVTNPFCSVSNNFCERVNDYGEGGKPTFSAMFHGEDMGFFGGVEWRTPIDKLTLKAEVSSDAYTREQQNSSFERKSPVNVGAEYRWREGITLGGYYMYGSTVGFNLVFSGNPYKPLTPQNLGIGPVPVNARPPDANRSTAWVNDPAALDKLTDALGDALNVDGISLQAISYSADSVDVRIVNNQISLMPKAIGRTARILAAGLPYSVEHFHITPVESGMPTTTVSVDRTDIEQQVDRPNAGQKNWETAGFNGAFPVLASGEIVHRDIYPLVNWAVIPVPTVQIFGGNNGFKPQLTAQFRGSVKVNQGLSFTTLIRQPILGEYSDPGSELTTGTLPPVRSESARYYAGWAPKLVRLSGDYLFKLSPDIYGRASAGVLERSFAGVGGEVLWKPVDQSWGLGADLNWVAQRDFDSPFGFGYYDYNVVTGHATVYWDTGWKGIETSLSAGRYLAGDWGATLAVSRQFANGWAIGAYATKTDVTGDQFGEGSFNKGITLSIPLRWSTPFETRQTVNGDLTSLGKQWRRVPEHSEPALSDRARPRPQPAGAQLGDVLGMRRILAGLSLVALTACGSGGKDPIVQAALSEAGGFWGKTKPAQEISQAPRAVTRADIIRADTAAIQARLESDPTPTLMYAASANGGYVTYVSPLRQEVTLHGTAQITGTRGLGTDLVSAWSSAPDPLARPMPVSRWPARVKRVYELPGEGPQGLVQSFDCTFERGEPAEMTILQIRYTGVQISETCVGASGTFENLHFVDPASGTIWRSLQWVGPKMELLDLQILEPFTGD